MKYFCLPNSEYKKIFDNQIKIPQDGTGGCDGCLNWKGVGHRYSGDEIQELQGKRSLPNLGPTDNNGLKGTVEILEQIYKDASYPNQYCLNI